MLTHLSHNDLDGYFCQYISSIAHPDEEINYVNVNYPEVEKELTHLSKILFPGDILTITDLNLTPQQVRFIEENLISRGVLVNLYDHHINEVIRPWMKVDKTRCASKLYADTLGVTTPFLEEVNAYDLWLRDQSSLDLGAGLSEFVFQELQFLNPSEKTRFYNFSFRKMEEAGTILWVKPLLEEYFQVENILSPAKFMAERYADIAPVEVSKGLYIITFDMKAFQYFSSRILDRYPDKILVNIGKNGSVSMRSREHNVQEIAKYCLGGGGHKYAAGGSLGKPISHIGEAKEAFLSAVH